MQRLHGEIGSLGELERLTDHGLHVVLAVDESQLLSALLQRGSFWGQPKGWIAVGLISGRPVLDHAHLILVVQQLSNSRLKFSRFSFM